MAPDGNTPTLVAGDEEDAEARVCMLSCRSRCCERADRGPWRSLAVPELLAPYELHRRWARAAY